ncbi:MAG: AAA family ATPase [Deltaproteobacteria bacterium]|nr:AAA family ATPase [Deltaproteobacteria bacterium]
MDSRPITPAMSPPDPVEEALRGLAYGDPDRLADLRLAVLATRRALVQLAPELGRRKLVASGMLTIHSDLIETIERRLGPDEERGVLKFDQVNLGEAGGVVSRGRGLLSCAGEEEEHPWGREEEGRVGVELDRIVGGLAPSQLAAVLLPVWALDEAPGCSLTRRSLAFHGNLHAVIELPDRTGRPGRWALVVLGRERNQEGKGEEILFLRPFAAHDPREEGEPGGALGWHCWSAAVGDGRDRASWRPDLPPHRKALEEVELLARAKGCERAAITQARAWVDVVPPRVDEDYLDHYQRQPPFREALRQGWRWADLPVPLPPIEVQREFAIKLEAAEAPAEQLLPTLEGRDWRDGEARPKTGTISRLKVSATRVVESLSEQVPPLFGRMLRQLAQIEGEQAAPATSLVGKITLGTTVLYDMFALETEAERDAKNASSVGQRVARLTAAADEVQALTNKGLILKGLGQLSRSSLLKKRNQAMGPVELVFRARAVLNRTVNGRVLLNLRNAGRADVYGLVLRWGVDSPAEGEENLRTVDVLPPGKTRVVQIPLPAGQAKEIRLHLRWSARNLLGAEVKGKVSLPIEIPELDDAPDLDDLLGILLQAHDWTALERDLSLKKHPLFERSIALALLNSRGGERAEAERALFEAARVGKDADELEDIAFFAQLLALPETGLAILEEAWERFPDEGDIALALGRARHWAGQDQRAVAPLARAIEEINSEALALLALVGEDPGDARLLLEKGDRDEMFNLMLLPWHVRQRDAAAVERTLLELRRARLVGGREVAATAFDLLTDREAEVASRLIEAYSWEPEEMPTRELIAAHVAHHRGDTNRRDVILAKFFGPEHRFRIDATRTPPPDVSNPYSLSKPITSDDAFFGRTDELSRLRRTVADPPTMGVALLEGARRTGKTSLLNKLGRELPDEILRVPVNLQEMGKPTVVRLWSWMGRQLVRGASKDGKPPSLPAPNSYETFAELVDHLLASGRWRGIALLIDEFECLDDAIRAGELPPDVLGQLRALLQSRPVGAVIAGAHALTERRLDYWSPLFGFATRVDLGPLDELSAAELVERPSDDSFPWSREAVSFVLNLTGRHPFFLRHLCAQVFEARRLRWRRRPVTRAEVNDAISAALHASEEHLREQYLSAPEPNGQRVLRRLAVEPVMDTLGVDREE